VPERTLADGTIRTPVDLDAVRAAARDLLDAGCEAVAILFANAYANPENEARAVEAVRALWPNPHVSCFLGNPARNPGIRAFLDHRAERLPAARVSGYLDRLDRALTQGGFHWRVHDRAIERRCHGDDTACRLPVRTALSRARRPA
jgi:N-methylhydantoinase A